jgi:hypothetical protein
MVTISNEKFWNIIESKYEKIRIVSRAQPQGVNNSISRVNDGIFSLSRYNFSNFLFDVIMSFESEKYWLSVSILGIDQTSSIFQLFFQSELVLLDQVLFVVLNTGQPKDAVLNVISHLHLVNIDSLLVVLLNIFFFDELLKSIMALLINLLRIRIFKFWQ